MDLQTWDVASSLTIATIQTSHVALSLERSFMVVACYCVKMFLPPLPHQEDSWNKVAANSVANIANKVYFWYDFVCLPQKSALFGLERTDPQNDFFQKTLGALGKIQRSMFPLTLPTEEYSARAWCHAEWMNSLQSATSIVDAIGNKAEVGKFGSRMHSWREISKVLLDCNITSFAEDLSSLNLTITNGKEDSRTVCALLLECQALHKFTLLHDCQTVEAILELARGPYAHTVDWLTWLLSQQAFPSRDVFYNIDEWGRLRRQATTTTNFDTSMATTKIVFYNRNVSSYPRVTEFERALQGLIYILTENDDDFREKYSSCQRGLRVFYACHTASFAHWFLEDTPPIVVGYANDTVSKQIATFLLPRVDEDE
jgi:hypothetical protein